MKFDKYSTEMGLPITIIIFVLTLFINQLFYAVAAAGILFTGIHAVHYFKNRLEYSKENFSRNQQAKRIAHRANKGEEE